MTALLLQSLYSGLLAGGAYALVALGLALVFGAMRVINLAHGELVLLAGYIAYMVEAHSGLNPLWSIPVSLVIVCLSSVLVYALLSRIKIDRELNSLILTYGIGVMLTNLTLLIWSADIHSTSSAWLQDAVVLGPFFAMRSEIVSFAMSLLLMGGLWLWLSRSWYGRAVRAVSSNREAAKIMGINPHLTEMVSFLVAGVLASCSGAAIYGFRVIQPSLGDALTIKAFIITVLAGVGSIPGVLAGAVILGVTEALTATLFNPAWQELASMALFLLVLFLRPNGLFGAVRRRG